MFQSVVQILLNSIESYPDKPALLYKENGKYLEISYRELGNRIEKIARGLLASGLRAGDRIAILSYNRPEWTISDFAIFSMGGVVVPIYHTLPPNQIAYILKDAGVRAIFVEDQTQYEKITQIKSTCPELEFIFPFGEIDSAQEELASFTELLERGEAHRQANPGLYRQTVDAIDPAAICSLVYTSGTTGNPKGVMLNHEGFVIDIVDSEAIFGIYPEDVFLSFLPLSHLYERLGGHWCPLYRGATIAYATDITTVVDNIQLVRPTVMVSVPRLYEKISSSVIEQVESGSGLKKKLFYWALKTGRRYHDKKFENRSDVFTSAKYRLADKVVFSKIKKKLGGRFRFPISGGAPLPTETLKFFEAIGLQIIEGYGMTETHLIIALTPPGKTKYGSCGKTIPHVEVKVDADGEILVRGKTVMCGYYNRPELTSEAIDKNGWLHTGDIGHLDEDNYLFITDRKKNILVTAGGKNIAPAPIENVLKLSKYIDDICLIGDKRKFISAIIIPNFDHLKKWADENGIPDGDNQKLASDPKVQQMMADKIEALQTDFARYEKVKKFLLLPEPLTIENGELTPSLKIKRNVVEKRFKSEIDKLYAEL